MVLRGLHFIGLAVLLMLLPHAYGENGVPVVRAIYGPWNYTQDERVGLDADYDNSRWKYNSSRILDKFARNSLEADALGITYVAGLYYLIDEAPFNYTRAVNDQGREQLETPSPVDETYWMQLIEEPAVAVANLSLYYPIWGLVWDFELYRANDGWETEYYSYDAPALESFCSSRGVNPPPLTPDQRHPWLMSEGLLQDYLEWQEEVVYAMARRTEERAHAINPNLTLGILGFADSWRYWLTLEAFSTPLAPVTLWTETTYTGYSEERIDSLQVDFDARGLNGKILPGLYTVALNPWRLIQDMERAIRHNGAFWIYQHNGDAYRHADELTYSRAYEIFDRYIFFSEYVANPLPIFDLYPGVEARPYGGGDSISFLLVPKTGVGFTEDVELLSGGEIEYIGENLSVIPLGDHELDYSDLPCILSGLGPGDLERTRAWSMIREISTLLEYYDPLGYPGLGELELALGESMGSLDAGRPDDIIQGLGPLIAGGYEMVLDRVWPDVEEAKKNPRKSPIPISALSRLSSARRMYDDGRVGEGNAYLIDGLKQWSEAIVEGPCFTALLILAACVYGRGRSRKHA